MLATVVRLLETTRMRVGNEEYARANDSFGLTTLRVRQVRVQGSTMNFRFRRKCYIHPAVIDAYMEGRLARTMNGKGVEFLRPAPAQAPAQK